MTLKMKEKSTHLLAAEFTENLTSSTYSKFGLIMQQI
jgi:hypothetical protein